MQGQLTGMPVEVRIESRCPACDRSLTIRVDQELRWSSPDVDARPLVFEPSIDWSRFVGPSILHAY